MLTLFTVCTLLGSAALVLAMRAEVELPDPPGRSARRGQSVWTGPVARGLVSFLTFFGPGGLLASWLGLSPTLQLTSALLAGLTVGGATAFALHLAGERPGRPGPSFVGRTGRVLESPQGNVPGRVLLSTDPEECLPVRSTDPLAPGDRVLVVTELGGLLDVRRWDRP